MRRLVEVLLARALLQAAVLALAVQCRHPIALPLVGLLIAVGAMLALIGAEEITDPPPS